MQTFHNINFSNLRISQETLNFEMDQFSMYTDLVNKYPGNKMYKKSQHNFARLIEDHQKLLNVESGLARVQYEIHDIALRLREYVKGKFDAIVFEPIIEMVSDFIKTNHRSMVNNYALQMSAFASTSAVLFIDVVPKDLKPEMEKAWQEGKEHLRQTIRAAGDLTRKGDPHTRVNNFCKKAKLDPEHAKSVLGSMQKIFPRTTKSSPLEIYSRDAGKPVAVFAHDGLDLFVKAKKDLDESLRPTEDAVVSGFLGQIYGWEEELPRFVIETNEGRRLTIRYSADRTSEVTQRFKKNVTLERIKEGGGWNLLAWQ